MNNEKIILDGVELEPGMPLWSIRFGEVIFIERNLSTNYPISCMKDNRDFSWNTDGFFDETDATRDLYVSKPTITVNPPDWIMFYGRVLRIGDTVISNDSDSSGKVLDSGIIIRIDTELDFPIIAKFKENVFGEYSKYGRLKEENERTLWNSREEYEASLPKKKIRPLKYEDFIGKPYPSIRYKKPEYGSISCRAQICDTDHRGAWSSLSMDVMFYTRMQEECEVSWDNGTTWKNCEVEE